MSLRYYVKNIGNKKLQLQHDLEFAFLVPWIHGLKLCKPVGLWGAVIVTRESDIGKYYQGRSYMKVNAWITAICAEDVTATTEYPVGQTRLVVGKLDPSFWWEVMQYSILDTVSSLPQVAVETSSCKCAKKAMFC